MTRWIRHGVTTLLTAGTMVAVVAVGLPSVLAAAPVATDDEVSVAPGELATFNVLSNDTDPDGGALQVVDVVVSEMGIQADCEVNGACTYRAIDGPGYADSFEYQLQDSAGEVDTGLVSIEVTGDTQETDVPSSVSIKYKRGKFKGSVSAEFEECQIDRKVVVKKGVTKIGKATTDDQGKWKLAAKAKSGKYKAVLKPVTLQIDQLTLNCSGDTATLKIG